MHGFSSRPLSPKERRRPSSRLIIAIVCGLLVLFPVCYAAFTFAQVLPSFTHVGNPLSILSNQDVPLQGQDQDRTNFLILGLTLDEMRTDTVLLVSYYYREKKLVAVNIPRDLYSYDGFETTKLASIFAHARARKLKDRTYAPSFLTDFLSKEYGIPIHYWVTLNMKGAVDLVDALGGVTIDVERPFTDYKYPTDDYSGYIRPAPHFNSGSQLMDGKTALIFARSRHSLMNNEGTDFARSHRQQLLLQAVLQKAKSEGLLGNVGQLGAYLQIFGKNVYTNMTLAELISAARLAPSVDLQKDFRPIEWSTQSGFFCDSKAGSGEYILLYGTRSNCQTKAGEASSSPYRLKAAAFIQSLLAESGSGALAGSSSSRSSAAHSKAARGRKKAGSPAASNANSN